MGILGYARFGAAGGDIGSAVSRYLGLDHPGRVVAVHRMDAGLPVFTGDPADLAPEERAAIRFGATLSAIGTSTVLRLPETAGKNLPSRGQVAVRGTINGAGFQTVLEPDGNSGHWMRVDDTLQHAAGISAGDTATLDIEVTRDWPEPGVPQDLAAALAAAPQKIQDLWDEITPMARWEWVRWVNATKNPDTRRRRAEVSISKMNSGKRRPCCFNLSACTDPDLSKNGRLLEPGDDRP